MFLIKISTTVFYFISFQINYSVGFPLYIYFHLKKKSETHKKALSIIYFI